MRLKAITILLGILIIFLLLYFSGIDEVVQILINSDRFYLGLAFLTFITSVILKSLRWHVILKSIKIQVPYSHAFYSFNSALFLSNITPFKALEPLRGYFLKVKFGYPFSKTIPLVITERAFDTFVYIIYSIITLQALMLFLPYYIIYLAIAIMSIFLILALIILATMSNRKLLEKIFKLSTKLPILNKLERKIGYISKEFHRGFKQLRKSRLLLHIILLTFLIWVVEGVIFLLSARAVGINLSLKLFAIPLMSILLGSLTMIPGGLGTTETAMVLIISFLGFSTPQATSAVLIYRFFVHLCENAIGAIVLPNVYGYEIVKKFIKSVNG